MYQDSIWKFRLSDQRECQCLGLVTILQNWYKFCDGITWVLLIQHQNLINTMDGNLKIKQKCKSFLLTGQWWHYYAHSEVHHNTKKSAGTCFHGDVGKHTSEERAECSTHAAHVCPGTSKLAHFQ